MFKRILRSLLQDFNIIQSISPSQLNRQTNTQWTLLYCLGWSVGIVNCFFLWQRGLFIPEKATLDFDVARFMVTRKEKENGHNHRFIVTRKEKENGDKTYQKEMAATLFKNANVADKNCRILSFKGKSSTASQDSQQYVSANLSVAKRAPRYIPQVKLGFHILFIVISI